ncbi:uncharacterized protein SOCEGT47_080850 [Sorangium cellulosum]|uniref:Uncharacterized protein n=1 Tax=Sorangium cellulosum TaxID=56 RepID=A0A4P2QCK8_SORCE|nr:uncharacterized protein SOCEGT47_080850 [Sorangium cellulosum]
MRCSRLTSASSVAVWWDGRCDELDFRTTSGRPTPGRVFPVFVLDGAHLLHQDTLDPPAGGASRVASSRAIWVRAASAAGERRPVGLVAGVRGLPRRNAGEPEAEGGRAGCEQPGGRGAATGERIDLLALVRA